MITLRRSEERRHLRDGGHDTWKTFDNESQNDPSHKGFRMLESLNEEGLAPGEGFLLRPLKDIEVFTYVWEGALTQEGLSGKTGVLDAGECHHASARSGTERRASN